MPIPKRISPDPIVDAVVELRFSSTAHPDAVFGLISNAIKEDFPVFQSLPVCQLPEDIRLQDPNLIFSPYYQSINGNFRLNVGPRVISLANINKYAGWQDGFFPKIEKLIKDIEVIGVITKIHRVGLRYVDFFQEDIFDYSKLQVSWEDNGNILRDKQVTTVLTHKDGLVSRIQMLNNAAISQQNGPPKTGSVIDTDVFYEPSCGFDFSGLSKRIIACHERAKTNFFSLLTSEFINSKNPEY